jgi:hypothetical protein
MPVDSAVFLGEEQVASGSTTLFSAIFTDFVPGSHQYLLTILSIWWCLGQLLSSLVCITSFCVSVFANEDPRLLGLSSLIIHVPVPQTAPNPITWDGVICCSPSAA